MTDIEGLTLPPKAPCSCLPLRNEVGGYIHGVSMVAAQSRAAKFGPSFVYSLLRTRRSWKAGRRRRPRSRSWTRAGGTPEHPEQRHLRTPSGDPSSAKHRELSSLIQRRWPWACCSGDSFECPIVPMPLSERGSSAPRETTHNDRGISRRQCMRARTPPVFQGATPRQHHAQQPMHAHTPCASPAPAI